MRDLTPVALAARLQTRFVGVSPCGAEYPKRMDGTMRDLTPVALLFFGPSGTLFSVAVS
jgi:hypothetical protein